jgi:hypothetical protein
MDGWMLMYVYYQDTKTYRKIIKRCKRIQNSEVSGEEAYTGAPGILETCYI